MEQTAAERVGISESAEGSALAVSGAARASGGERKRLQLCAQVRGPGRWMQDARARWMQDARARRMQDAR